MRNFLNILSLKYQKLMQNRYGIDEFSLFLNISGIILLILSTTSQVPLFYILTLLCIGYSFYRMLSPNIEKRHNELVWYLNNKYKITKKIAKQKEFHQMKKTHRLYKCKNCKTILRVPKGVGKIKITCAKCKTTMIKRA